MNRFVKEVIITLINMEQLMVDYLCGVGRGSSVCVDNKQKAR